MLVLASLTFGYSFQEGGKLIKVFRKIHVLVCDWPFVGIKRSRLLRLWLCLVYGLNCFALVTAVSAQDSSTKELITSVYDLLLARAGLYQSLSP